MKIILIRHGETDFNRDGIYMGRRFDAPINSTGRAQIESIVPEIRPLSPELIVSSPMRRTRESAEVIGEKLHIPIEFDERIVEIEMGSLSGKNGKDIVEIRNTSLGEALSEYREGRYDYSPFGGESSEAVDLRASLFFKDLAKRKLNCVVVVSHGGLIRALYKAITGRLYAVDKRMPNGAVIVLEYAKGA